MKKNKFEYIDLLERTLLMAQQRGDLLKNVIGNYGSHKADEYLRNIKALEQSIDENTAKIHALKEVTFSQK